MVGRCTVISKFKSIPLNKLRFIIARAYTGKPYLKTKQKQKLRITILLHIPPSEFCIYPGYSTSFFLIPACKNTPCADITCMYVKSTAWYKSVILTDFLSLVLAQLHFLPFYFLFLSRFPFFPFFFLTSFSLPRLTLSLSPTLPFFQSFITQAVKMYNLSFPFSKFEFTWLWHQMNYFKTCPLGSVWQV